MLALSKPVLAFISQQWSICASFLQAAELYRILLHRAPTSEQQSASKELHDVVGADALRCLDAPLERTHVTCRAALTVMLCICRVLVAAGAMQALIAAADTHGGLAVGCLPEALGHTLAAVAGALETVADFPLKEAVDAADLWAAQTGMLH